jgi:hypothetical protein
MTFILIIGAIWFIFWVIGKASGPKPSAPPPRTQSRGTTSTGTTSRTNTPPPTPRNETVYRPQSGHNAGSPISFKSSNAFELPPNTIPDIAGLHDAFTGALLNPSLGLYQCSSCKVFYHTESLEVIRQENNGRCVACASTNIQIVTDKAGQKQGGRDYDPNVVTLANYKEHVGRVVTFEARVQNVLTSRSGNDYAVMFENTGWVKGFKLVFFRKTISTVGGANYIQSLSGKTIRVRGLVKKHEKFGYQIIVSQKSMILSAR